LVCYYYYYEKKYKLDLKDKIKNHKNVDKRTKKNPKNKDQTEINLLVLKKIINLI